MGWSPLRGSGLPHAMYPTTPCIMGCSPIHRGGLPHATRGASLFHQGHFPMPPRGLPMMESPDGCLHMHPLEPCRGGVPHGTKPAWWSGDPGYPEGGSALHGMGNPGTWQGEARYMPWGTPVDGVGVPSSSKGGPGEAAQGIGLPRSGEWQHQKVEARPIIGGIGTAAGWHACRIADDGHEIGRGLGEVLRGVLRGIDEV